MTTRIATWVVATAMLALAAVGARAEDVVQPAGSDVSPPGVMPVRQGGAPVIREAAAATTAEQASWQRYVLPETTDAATFSVPELVIHIAGVHPPAASDTCTVADGGTWPCGQTALYALRRFLQGRPVECYFPDPEGVSDVTAPCRMGDVDIGLWLLKYGWARPGNFATEAYVSASKAAQCRQAGIWREETPPSDCPAKG